MTRVNARPLYVLRQCKGQQGTNSGKAGAVAGPSRGGVEAERVRVSGAAAALPARADEPSAAVVLLSVHASAARCPYAGRLCGRVQTARVPCCTAASACVGHSQCSAADQLMPRPQPAYLARAPHRNLAPHLHNKQQLRNNEEQRLPKQSDRHTHNRKSRSSRPDHRARVVHHLSPQHAAYTTRCFLRAP